METAQRRDVLMVLGVGTVVALLPLGIEEFYLYVIRLIIIYAISALGLNLFMGYCGQINVGSAGFFCFGAYVPTMLGIKFGWHYLAAFPFMLVCAFLLAWGVSYPLLRLKGHAMAIGTLSFALAIYLIAERFPALTGGADGIVVPPVALLGHTLGNLFYYYFILVFGLAAYLMCHFLVDSRIGRAWKAIREEEAAAAAMGVDVDRYKRLAWLINCLLASLAGSLFAQQTGFLSPTNFSLWTNIVVLVMIVVGGLGINLGSIVGAVIMTSLPYLLISIQQYILFTQGMVLAVCLTCFPYGVVGSISRRLRRSAVVQRSS